VPAAIAWDLDARKNLPQEAPDELMLSRAQSRMLNALHNAAEAARHTETPEATKTFDQMMQARGTDIPAIARLLKVPRIVIGTVFRGGIVGAVSRRFRDALSSLFGEPGEAIDAAVDDARMHPCLGLAKANGTPTGAPLSFDALVRSSGMSPEEIEYWLA
jgi:hypothetical protein